MIWVRFSQKTPLTKHHSTGRRNRYIYPSCISQLVFLSITFFFFTQHIGLEYWNCIFIYLNMYFYANMDVMCKDKSNQITFIVTSPQHMCLGELNSWEGIYIYIYIYMCVMNNWRRDVRLLEKGGDVNMTWFVYYYYRKDASVANYKM